MDDLINRSFRAALEQEKLEPLAQANITTVNLDEEPYHFIVEVQVEPEIEVPDYQSIRIANEPVAVTDEMLDAAMESRRERHVVLREPEEPRAAQVGDQLTVLLEASVNGEPLDDREPGTPPAPSTLVLESERLAPGLFEGLVGAQIDQTIAVVSQMPDDHNNDEVAGKTVDFVVTVQKIEERLLPDFDELPTLEEFEGTLDELRTKTHEDLVKAANDTAETKVIDGFVEQLVGQTSFDLPAALIEREASRLLQQRESEYARYGITPEQIYEMQGRTRDDAVAEILPQGEERLKVNLVMRELLRREGIALGAEELNAEVDRLVEGYDEAMRERAREMLSGQLIDSVASSVIDRKLRERILQLATGTVPIAVESVGEVGGGVALE